MNKKVLFKIMSMIGLAFTGIGTVLSSLADRHEMEATIEEKVNEALMNHNK